MFYAHDFLNYSYSHSCELPTHPQVIPPKHIPIPELPPSSDLYFELDSFCFFLLAMGGQYVNLYRSVFWLPYSHTDYALVSTNIFLFL